MAQRARASALATGAFECFAVWGSRRALSLVLVVSVISVVGGCGSSSPSSPAEALRRAAELAHRAGSVRADGTAGGSEPAVRTTFDATLSWSPGVTAEFRMPRFSMPEHRMTVRFTSDAQYLMWPTPGSSALGGRPWGKRLYHQLGGDPDPAVAPERWRASLGRVFPAPFAAMLSQAPDLRLIGEEQRGGVAARHYAGTVESATLTAAAELGLTEDLVRQLRQEAAATGVTGRRLDVWLARDGYPLGVESRHVGGGKGKKRIVLLFGAYEPVAYLPVLAGEPFVTLNYRDYGEPGPVTAPPAEQVRQFGSLPSAPRDTVEEYLTALNAHDRDAARGLLSPAYAEEVERMADSPFRNVISISGIRTSPAVPYGGSRPGLWRVGATFDLRQRAEVSTPNGPTSREYRLAPDPATGEWLIIGASPG